MTVSAENLTVISAITSAVALIVSTIALIYTARAYLLKSGVSVRGTYSICSDIACEDEYVNSVTLENLKDRAVIIFSIYLRLGHNYFVEIDDFEDEPLILKPFEAFKKQYDPVDLYSTGMKRILMNDLFDVRVKKQLVLSTSDGRYNVKSNLVAWDPVIDFFKNYMTAIVRPMRSTFKGRSYGGNAKYIVEFKFGNQRDEVVAIYPRDHQIKKFRTFRLSEESLKSKEALLEFLYDRVSDGGLSCTDLEVYDAETWRKERYEMQQRSPETATYHNWFMYYVIGKIATNLNNYKISRENRALRKKQ